MSSVSHVCIDASKHPRSRTHHQCCLGLVKMDLCSQLPASHLVMWHFYLTHCLLWSPPWASGTGSLERGQSAVEVMRLIRSRVSCNSILKAGRELGRQSDQHQSIGTRQRDGGGEGFQKRDKRVSWEVPEHGQRTCGQASNLSPWGWVLLMWLYSHSMTKATEELKSLFRVSFLQPHVPWQALAIPCLGLSSRSSVSAAKVPTCDFPSTPSQSLLQWADA